MPWVQAHLSKSHSREDYDLMKIEIAKILHDEFDKAEQGLSVSFYTPAAFYRAGEATVTAAVVDVRYIGTFPLAKKQAVTRRIAAFLSERWDYDPLKTTVVFSEIESGNWGRKGGDFS